jgi:alpha-glucosidase
MARATYHGVKNLYTQSAFIIYQISIPGAQRYTSWTGDNVASWEHLWIANIQVQRVSFLVWVQILWFYGTTFRRIIRKMDAIKRFSSFCRSHSSGDHGNQEPWSLMKK